MCAQWKMEHKSNEKEAEGRREGGAHTRPEEDDEGRKPASQPAARMLETAGARAPDEEGEKKLICIANELLSEPPPPSILGGKKSF